MKPSIGRVVHYAQSTPHGNACRAAFITDVSPSTEVASLTVFTPHAGTFFVNGIAHDEAHATTKSAGTWHWPERVEE